MSGRRSKVWMIRGGFVLLMLVAWTAIGASGPGMGRLFPGAGELVVAFGTVLGSDSFGADLSASLRGIGLGFAIGGSVGLLMGGIVGVSPRLTRLLEPMFYWASSVPKIILLPINLLIFGSGVPLQAAHGALSSVFPVAIGMVTAVVTMRPIYTRVARTFGLRRWKTAMHVWAPAASGQILTALRIGLSNAVVSALLVETAIGSQGLGFRAIRYYSNLQVAEMYALILIVFFGAMVVNIGLEALIRSRTKHFEDARSVAV